MPSPDVPTTLTSDLRRLGLLRTADDLNDILARATRHRWSSTVLLEHLVTAELEERQRRSIERRLTAALLAIDEIGYLAYDAHAADLLFQIVSRRYEHRPLLMTTNLAFKHWDTIFPNASVSELAGVLPPNDRT